MHLPPRATASARFYTHRLIARTVAYLLRPGAVFNSENFRLWEGRGYHITPVHFYYPIPDTGELATSYPKRSNITGIDMRPASQHEFVNQILRPVANEFQSLVTPSGRDNNYNLENGLFESIDACAYYGIVRFYKPRLIIEAGSGFSTILAAAAIKKNDTQTKYIAIDPYPNASLIGKLAGVDIVRSRIEKVTRELFDDLRENDILFIDSSHVVRTGGDVCYLFLEVLPRLRRGVLIHVHDIYLPWEYPKELLLEANRFWSEQYLLQAYLAENDHVEVMFASNYMTREHPSVLENLLPRGRAAYGASFWLRKR